MLNLFEIFHVHLFHLIYGKFLDLNKGNVVVFGWLQIIILLILANISMWKNNGYFHLDFLVQTLTCATDGYIYLYMYTKNNVKSFTHKAHRCFFLALLIPTDEYLHLF